MAYDAFISYSHSADGQLAPAVQSGLQRLARPWYRRRALRVFRDETGLAVNPHLWGSIERAMDESRYFVLLASPAAAASPWVTREVEHWLATKPPETLLPVLTDGTLVWDNTTRNFDLVRSSALSLALVGIYAEEPRFLDVRWARDETQLDLRNGEFRSQMAALAAPIHGMAKEDLEGEDVRLHRRALRLAWAAAGALVLLTLAAIATSALAVNSASAARRSERRALEQQQRADGEARLASAERAEAEREKQVADVNAVQARASASDAQREKRVADQSATLADDQKRLADLNAQQAHANAQQAHANAQQAQANAQQAEANAQRAQQNAIQARRNLTLADSAQLELVDKNSQLRTKNDQLAQEKGRLQSTNLRLDHTNVALVDQRNEATRQRDDAESHSLAASAISAFDSGRFDLGLLLAGEATRISPDAPARGSLLSGLRLQPTLVGHLQGLTNDVEDVAFSPDGRLVAAADRDGTVDVWDAQARARIAHHHPATFCDAGGVVAFSPDSAQVASATKCGHEVVLWQSRTGVTRRVLHASDAVSAVAFDQTGTQLVAGSVEGSATVWNVHTGQVTHTLLSAPGRDCLRLAFSPDGHIIACAGIEEHAFGAPADAVTVQFWNATTAQPLGPPVVAYPGLNKALFSLTFSADSKTMTTVASGIGVRPLIRWDVTTGQPTSVPFGPLLSPPEATVAVSPDFRQLVSENPADQSISVRDATTGTSAAGPLRLPLGGAFDPPGAITFSPDGRTLAAGGGDGAVRLWQSDTPTRLATRLPISVATDDQLRVSPDGRLAERNHRGTTILINVALGTPLAPQPPIGGPFASSIVFSGDSQTLVWIDADHKIRRWDLTTGRLEEPAVGLRSDCFFLIGVSFDGRTAATPCGLTGLVELIDLDSGRVHDLHTTNTNELYAAFSRDGRRLALGGTFVQLWDLPSGSLDPTQPLEQGTGSFPASLAFSPDGRTLAAGGALGSPVVLWDTSTGEPRRTTPNGFNFSDAFNAIVAFSPDSQTIATGAADGAVRLWDTGTAQPIGEPLTRLPVLNAQVQARSGAVQAVAFTADGQSLISAIIGDSNAGTNGPNDLTRWDLRLSTWQQQACTIANRNLTPAEWAQYIGPAIAYRKTCDQLP
jgi:WD40 repeat protein